MNAAVAAHKYVERKRDPAKSIHAQVKHSNEWYALVRVLEQGDEYFLQFRDGKIFIGGERLGDGWMRFADSY